MITIKRDETGHYHYINNSPPNFWPRTCVCGLSFNSCETRDAHKCLTKQELLMLAADKIVELAEKLLIDYNELHDDPAKDELFGFPMEDAIEEYRSLKNG